MKKLFFNLALFIIFTFITITVILSTIGIKTDKFNNLISKKINETNNNVNININKIKFKLDVKAISLFLETRDTEVNYRDLKIPVKNIKVYIFFLSLIKIVLKIKKITLNFYQLNQDEIKKISSYLKPSNFTSFINNKLKKKKLNTKLEIYLDRNNLIENFISRGSVSNLKFEILNKINLENTRFTFFADKSDILLKNISSSTDSLKILDGDLKINLSKEISLDTNFKTLIKSDSKNKQLQKLVNQFRLAENLVKIEADLNNMIKLSLDKTLKIRKFNYSGKGNISKAQFNFDNPISNNFLIEKVNNLSFVDLKFDINSNFKKTISNISGKYSIDKTRPLSFSLRSNFIKDLINLDLVFDYTNAVEIDFINYRKSKDVNSKIAINLDKKKNNYVFNKISFSENKNSILAQGISIDNERFLSAKKISVLTNKDGKINNNFLIIFEKKMKINGKKFDASNLPKILNQNKKKIDFSSLNKEIEIDFTNIILPLSENLSNFKLIGKIENGKFSKISSKGDFGYNNFLDVTMKNDKKSKKNI